MWKPRNSGDESTDDLEHQTTFQLHKIQNHVSRGVEPRTWKEIRDNLDSETDTNSYGLKVNGL